MEKPIPATSAKQSSQDDGSFRKYDTRGAYHWRALSRNPRKHNAMFAARYQVSLDLLGDVRGLTVVDLGCGDGALSGMLARAGAKVIGVDPSPTGLSLARREFDRRKLSG